MAKFYKIQIGDIYLTDTGEADGDPVKLLVPGADALLLSLNGTTVITCGGSVNQLFKTSQVLEIRILTYISAALWRRLVSLINTASQNSATINLIGIGDINDFEVAVNPLLPRPFEAQEFKNGRILKPIFRFITV